MSAEATQIRAVLPGAAQLPPTDRLLLPGRLQPSPTRRLVVLVPAGETDEPALARRIWELATTCQLNILYLALSPSADLVAFQRRRLVSLAALSADRRLRADIQVRNERSWIQALRSTMQPGDLLVCLAADRASNLFRSQGLGNRLAAEFGFPVYELGELQVSLPPTFQLWIKNVLGWVASLASMVGFFWLQVGIDRSAARPQATILLLLSVLVELYAIWKINEWIG